MRTNRIILSVVALVCCVVKIATAQVPPPPDITTGEILNRVGIDQNLGASLPLDTEFRDESGRLVKLRDCFSNRPVILALVYLRCPMLCNLSLNGLTEALRPLKFTAGKDFDVVVISFDPRETPELAAAKKATYLKEYGRASSAGWHFLTGSAGSSSAVAKACGFRYFYDARSDQYAHASGIMLLTSSGQLSRYFYGVEYSTKDIQLGLVEASEGKIGSLADQILLLCFHYDPRTGKYGLAIVNSLKIGGCITMVAIATYVIFMLRRERTNRRIVGTA